MSDMSSAYRIHSRDESLETLLDHSRKDGWVASDESADTQPVGISCCSRLEDLERYVLMYSLNIRPGDVLVELSGDYSDDDDRDQYAARFLPESYDVICEASEWFSFCQSARAAVREDYSAQVYVGR